MFQEELEVKENKLHSISELADADEDDGVEERKEYIPTHRFTLSKGPDFPTGETNLIRDDDVLL